MRPTRTVTLANKSTNDGQKRYQSWGSIHQSGTPPTYWTVDRLLEFPNTPPHVRLVRRRDETSNTRVITIAISALMDRKNYKPVAA